MNYETHELMVCSDCAIWHANGDAGDWVDLDTLLVDIDSFWPHTEGWRITVGDDYNHFSWSWCDSCGTNLGGDRTQATAWRTKDN